MIYKANLGKRIIATLIDYGLFFGFFYCYALYFGTDTDGEYTVTGWAVLPINIMWLLYFVVIEGLNGATLGHGVIDLKVVTVTGKQIDIFHALKRHLLDPIDILIYGIPAIIAIKNSDKRQRLGDMWAKTVVINTKDTAQLR